MNKHTPGPWELHIQKDTGEGRVPTLSDGRHYWGDYHAVVGKDGFVICDNTAYYAVPPSLDDARLIAAAPELLEAQTMGSQVNTPDFLDWMADRLINVYGESPNVDFVLSLRERAMLAAPPSPKQPNHDLPPFQTRLLVPI